MPLKFDRKKLSREGETSWLALDLFMVGLVTLNLAFIVFDTLFAARAVQEFFAAATPTFHDFYLNQIHEHFLFYDLIFIAVFLAEFVFQWIMAVRRKTYARWYFFPFLRWYDLLGCIPVGSFRLLRLLRLVSLLVRLQKRDIIDLTNTRVFQFFLFYYNAFVDEITDNVQIQVLNDIKREIEDESPITREIITEVIAPQRELLVTYISRRVGAIADRSHDKYREEIRAYIESVVSEAVTANRNIGTLEKLPFVGRMMIANLEEAINDIVYQVFQRIVDDVSQTENNRVVDEIVNVVFDLLTEKNPELGDISTRMASDAIDLIKERIRIQHWKDSLRQSTAQGADPAEQPVKP